MYRDNQLYVAHCSSGPLHLIGKMASRHGLIAGATGTGKTVTLQVLAETFSQAGVPCFMADMKGDLSGISQTGRLSGFIEKRCAEFGIDPSSLQFKGCPVRLFDVYGRKGHPMRTTVQMMGAMLLSRLLDLNDTQSGVLALTFRIAEDEQLPLVDMKDLRLMLDYVAKNADRYSTTYGNVSSATIGAIQRSLLTLADEGGEEFFGEPAFDIYDLMQTEGGRGVMSVLAADELMLRPKLYSTFLMWLLTSIYEKMPEVGEVELPRMVFFFDEAHMLFKDTSRALRDKIEQIVRLIRSKGVGIYFITQSPSDLPEAILGQCGNRVQHALRAFTPKDQAAVKAAAETFRPNPAFSTDREILELGTGEALVSLLDEKGAPSMVERAKVLFPMSQIGAITDEQRAELISSSRLAGKYDEAVDRESAFEKILKQREAEAAEAAKAKAAEAEAEERERAAKAEAKGSRSSSTKKSVLATVLGTAVTYFAKTLATQMARKITGGTTIRTTTKKKTTKRKK
jgi:DNA helicase HerA-like ATPase